MISEHSTDAEWDSGINKMTCDSHDSPLRISTESHPPMTYSYDVIGGMIGLTDEVGSTTSFLYGRRGLLESKTDPLTRNTTLVYSIVESERCWRFLFSNGDTD